MIGLTWVIGLFRPKSYKLREQRNIERLRRHGVRIGADCRIYSSHFSTEPWLVTIGDRVGIAGGVKFLTHDGSAMLVRERRPEAQKLGHIQVGSDVFISENAILLPGTSIGDGSIIGPGAVVHGSIPPNSLVYGNPADIIGRASLYRERLLTDPNTLDTLNLPATERRKRILAHFGLAGAKGDRHDD